MARCLEELVTLGELFHRVEVVAFDRDRQRPSLDAVRINLTRGDGEDRVQGFVEKPASPPSGNISMGVYVFRTSALHAMLREDAERDTAHDFGRNILPAMVGSGHVQGFRHDGYWQDIGTLDSYYRANLDLLRPDPPFPLEDPRWPIFTPSTEFPPARIGMRAEVRASILTHGTIVNGIVERSVLFPGAVVEEGATVRDSIVMGETWVGPLAEIRHSILDKRVHVGPRARVGYGTDLTPNRSCPEHLSSGITIVGKETRIPEGVTIGRNCRVSANLIEEDFPEDTVPSGGVMERELNVAH